MLCQKAFLSKRFVRDQAGVAAGFLWLLPLLAALFLSACLAQPHPEKNIFGLNLDPAEIQSPEWGQGPPQSGPGEIGRPGTGVMTTPASRAKVGRRTVLLATVTAASGYENRSLVYKVGPEPQKGFFTAGKRSGRGSAPGNGPLTPSGSQFKVDFYNEFLAPPARLLADQTAQFLDRQSSRLRVVKTPGLALADYGLETYLEHIHGDFTGPAAQADLAVRFTLNDLRGRSPRVVLDRTYRRARPLAEDSPAALVSALSECLADILNELNQDMNRSVR